MLRQRVALTSWCVSFVWYSEESVSKSSKKQTNVPGDIDVEPSTRVEGVEASTRVEAADVGPVSKPTKWGRCGLCQRAMRPRLRADGQVFLGCSGFEKHKCPYTASAMQADILPKLPNMIKKRKKMDF